MTKHFFGDTAVLLGRSLRHIMRSLDTIITTTIMPIVFMLLFVYVFGGAINSGSDSYVNYLLPGILLITIASVPRMFHLNLTDVPLLIYAPFGRRLGLFGPIDAHRVHRIVNAYTLAFFATVISKVCRERCWMD